MHALALPFARNPFRRLSELVVTLLVIVVLMLLTACAGLNPVAVAQTPEQKYDAALLAYDALLDPALEIVEDPAAPANVRESLQAAIKASGDVYAGAVKTFADFKAAKAAVAAGGPGAQLDVATENLNQWTEQLVDVTARIRALSK